MTEPKFKQGDSVSFNCCGTVTEGVISGMIGECYQVNCNGSYVAVWERDIIVDDVVEDTFKDSVYNTPQPRRRKKRK